MNSDRLQLGPSMRVACCLLVGLVALAAQAQPGPSNQPITFVFLNAGAGRAKLTNLTQEAVGKMQAAHVGNFGTQFNQGNLMAAGPLGDNAFIRGTVILPVQTPAEITDCFKPDPFVQNDILGVEAHPWLVDVLKFGTPKVPFALARHTLCIVKKGTNWLSQTGEPVASHFARLMPSLQPKERSGELALGGPFLDGGDKLGVFLFYSTNQALIRAALEKEPAVTEGWVQLEFHPQFMGEGTLRVPGESEAPPKSANPRPLFDGQTFAGWEGETNRTWRVESDALIGGSLNQTVPHNEFLSFTKEFKNFDLRLKVKLTGTGFVNGGIQFRSQRLKEPAFEMIGYQADMGEGYWGSLYDESRRKKTLAHTYHAVVQRILKPNDWNDYVIRCEGPRVRLWLNGVLTVDYAEADKSVPLGGFIALQIHGGGKAEASYKNIMLEELPADL
jgi:hypothetical protein